MKSVIGYYLVLSLLSLNTIPSHAEAFVEAVIGEVDLKANPNLATLPSVASQEVIISRDQYVISYNKERRSPNWVAWKVESEKLGKAQRSNVFSADSELQAYLNKVGNVPPAVSPEEYKGSCFDRGHQAPSADRTGSAIDNQSTFVMSNMVPQTPFLNRYLWQRLEGYTRELVAQGKTIFVIAGPVYDKNFGDIGPNKDIPIPSKSFKVMVILDKGQTPKDINDQTPVVSVLMPNVLKNGDSPTDKKTLCGEVAMTGNAQPTDWQQYRTTVSEIEKVSGLSLKQFP